MTASGGSDHATRLSARSVSFRYFAAKQRLTDAFVQRVALVATLLEGGEERIIGVGRYVMLASPAPRWRSLLPTSTGGAGSAGCRSPLDSAPRTGGRSA